MGRTSAMMLGAMELGIAEPPGPVSAPMAAIAARHGRRGRFLPRYHGLPAPGSLYSAWASQPVSHPLQGLGDDLSAAGIPDKLTPGRYEVGVTIRGVTGDATESPPDVVPFLWNWDKGPFGSGKLNLEREFAAQGIKVVAISAKDPKWKNPRRSGYLDVFSLSPMLWDVSFTLTLDILGPAGADGVSGLGIAPVIYVAAVIAIIAITQAVVKSLGGGDVVIDFVRKVGEAAGQTVQAVVKPALDVAASPFKSVSGLILIGVAVLGVVIWAKASPHGRAAKAALWG